MIKILNHDECNGCETCVSNCPLEVLNVEGGKVRILDGDMCTDCGLCVEVCPKAVIERVSI